MYFPRSIFSTHTIPSSGMGLVLPTIEAYQGQHLPIVKAYADKIGVVEVINLTFKGVWLIGANFAPLAFPDTRRDQYPWPHKR